MVERAARRRPGPSRYAAGGLAARICALATGSLAALVCALATGCGPAHGEAWTVAFAAAQRAHNAGRYPEAATLYADAAARAERIKDRDEALFLRARMLHKLGRFEEARGAYAELAAGSPDGPRTARAIFEHASLTIEHGDAEAGWRLLEEAMLRYPNHGSAKLAVAELVEHHRAGDGGERGLQARLHGWRTRVPASETAQQLEYEIGRSLEREGRLAEAHAQMLAAARAHPYPKGNLTDDALWNASLIAERLGDPAQAIADLRELLGVREVAAGGSYERPRFPASQYRIAELYRDRLGDLPAARRALAAVYTEHPTSILADDAMWQELLLARRLGDPAEVCALAKGLPERFPDSRYVRCVGAACPAALPPPGVPPPGVPPPGVPPPGGRACPAYLLRQLDAAP